MRFKSLSQLNYVICDRLNYNLSKLNFEQEAYNLIPLAIVQQV